MRIQERKPTASKVAAVMGNLIYHISETEKNHGKYILIITDFKHFFTPTVAETIRARQVAF
jgi:hypothetical protein